MKYLSDYMNDKQTELFNQVGAFFAFGPDQLNEQRVPGVKYVPLGAGLICPQDKVKELKTGLETILTEAIHQDVADNGPDKIIEREYWNYETQITMNPSDATDAISRHIKHYPDLFTPERIRRVMNQCYEVAVEKSLF